jgi:hypothetical protein
MLKHIWGTRHEKNILLSTRLFVYHIWLIMSNKTQPKQEIKA